MKTGSQPKPSLRSGPNKLARLDAVTEWTEEPARAQVSSLVKETIVQETGEIIQTPEVKVAAKKSRAAAAPVAVPQTPTMPQKVPVQLTTFKLPSDLYHTLKWVAGSIPGESMTTILVRALNTELAVLQKRLGARGRVG